MTSKSNISPNNDLDTIKEVEIQQEGTDNLKFVISEVFLVDSDAESGNDDAQLNMSSSDPLAESIFGLTSSQTENVTRNLGRLGKVQRFHDLPCTSKSQPTRTHYTLHGEGALQCGAIGICEVNLNENDGVEAPENHCEILPLPTVQRRPRKPTKQSMNNLCRICEQHSYALTNIFGKSGNTSSIIEKIHLHLPITVKRNDKLPQGICGSCLQALKNFHDVYQKSLSTDSHIRELFLEEDSSKFFSFQADAVLPSNKSTLQNLEEDQSISTVSINQESTIDDDNPSSFSDTRTFLQKKSSCKPTKTSGTIKNWSKTESVLEESPNLDSDSSENDDGVSRIRNVNDEYSLQDEEEENEEPFSSLELEKRTCDICQQTFSSQVEMKKHRSEHSAEERLKCKVCGKIMPNDKSYHTHLLTHTDNVHLCPKCGKVLASASGVRNHLLTHEEPKFCCQICGKTARTIQKLDSHMVTHSDKRDWECEKCGQKFKLKGGLKQHMNVHSQSPKFVCDLCGYAVHRSSHLRYHMTIHHNDNGKLRKGNLKYPCDMCSMKFMKKPNLVRHQVAAHGAKPALIVSDTAEESQEARLPVDALCVYCNIQFPSKEALRSHKKEHHPLLRKQPCPTAPSLNLPCPHCGKRLSTKRSLDYHVRTHTGECPFSCSVCGESFQSEVKRERHELKHTNNRPYKCNICDKAFFAYTSLYQHKQVHNADKRFKCNYCNYKTCRAAALKIHLRVHTGEKPYACELCDRKYKSSWDLKLHKRVHTGDSPYRRIRSKPKQMRLQEEQVISDLDDVFQ